MGNKTFCAFIDVLGIGNLVLDNTILDSTKFNILNSIYTNIATQLSTIVREMNSFNADKINLRSFSDSFYLECSKVEHILCALNDFYNYTFGFYTNFSPQEERTPLLRSGVVYETSWKFHDIGAMAVGKIDWNPVGPGIARAYNTSENSGFSGMRIIISDEVLSFLELQEKSSNDFLCKFTMLPTYMTSVPIHFRQIEGIENKKPKTYYELIWTFSVNGHQYDYVDELIKLQHTFTSKTKRHLLETIELVKLGLKINGTNTNLDVFNTNIRKLDALKAKWEKV